MKICVIGGTGHIGRNLVEMLVGDGFEVAVVARGRTPVPTGGPWDKVRVILRDYRREDPEWAACLRAIGAEVVVDIPGTDVPATYDAVKGSCQHVIAAAARLLLSLLG